MHTIVKAAAAQISPILYSRQGTVEKIVNKIRELDTLSGGCFTAIVGPDGRFIAGPLKPVKARQLQISTLL